MVVVLMTPSLTFSESLPFVFLSGAATPYLVSRTTCFLLCVVLGTFVSPWRRILPCTRPLFADVLRCVDFAVTANRAKG